LEAGKRTRGGGVGANRGKAGKGPSIVVPPALPTERVAGQAGGNCRSDDGIDRNDEIESQLRYGDDGLISWRDCRDASGDV
jgi:hypothetical protein